MNIDQLSKTKLKRTEPNYVYGKGGSQHSYSHVERRSFVDYINYILRDDPDLKSIIPINKETDQIFQEVKNGLLLCKFVNALSPGAIDETKLGRKSTNMYEMFSNINLAIKGAEKIGCNLVNISADDIYAGKPHIILGFFWNVIRNTLLNKVSLDNHPELINILQKDEDVSNITDNNPEKVLLRWFNFHLKNANHPRVVNNFKRDISDGENYLVLLEQIAPDIVPNTLHNEPDPKVRATMVCETASALNALKFISPEDILNGNEKLNLAFTAYLFHKYPGLEKKSTVDVESQRARQKLLDDEEIKRLQALEEQKMRDEMKLRELEEQRLKKEEEMRRNQLLEEQRLKKEEEMRRMRELEEQKIKAEEIKLAEYQRLVNEENALKLEKMKLEDEQQRRMREEHIEQIKMREEQIRQFEESQKLKEHEMRQQEEFQKMKEFQISQMEEQQRLKEESMRKIEEQQRLREERLRWEEEEQMRTNERLIQTQSYQQQQQQQQQQTFQQPFQSQRTDYSQYSQASGDFYNQYQQQEFRNTNPMYQENAMFASNTNAMPQTLFSTVPFNNVINGSLFETSIPPPLPHRVVTQPLILQQPSLPTFTISTFSPPPPPPPPPRRVVIRTTTTFRKRI